MMHVSFVKYAAACCAITLLAGCETMSMSLGKKIDYKSSGSVSSLEVPPDLTTPTYDDRAVRALFVCHLSCRPCRMEVLPIPLVQPVEAVAAGVAHLVVRTRDVPIE